MVEILKLAPGPSGQHPPVPRAPLRPVASEVFDPLASLLAETATGHERAFARLYELVGGRLFAVACRIMGRADLAEDVLQESFLRIWRSAHQYDPAKGPAYAWLVRIVRNRALSARTRAAKHDTGRTGLDEDLASDTPDPAAQVLRSEEARRVNACLTNLPLNHRRSVAMVYFEGLTHRELADRLDVQLGTAKSWVRRGLAKMSQCLNQETATDWRALVAADYAIGSLQGAARRGFERRRERDARYCRAADLWETELAMLTEFLPDRAPPAAVWKRIEQGVKGSRVSFAQPLFWQVTAGCLAAAVVALLVVLGR
jgi:RNA polymerase sigma-70 factor (ECF subfamily)